MSAFALRLHVPKSISPAEARASFFWTAEGRSTFTTGLGPSLGGLGPVADLNVDLVRIAAAAFAADRSVLRQRGGSDWNQREFELSVPVSNLKVWRSARADLESVLGFLTGDRWTVKFVKEASPTEAQALGDRLTGASRVVLLSGGADSAVGALEARAGLGSDEKLVLLSHYSATALAPTQRAVADEAQRLLPGPAQEHLAIHLGRTTKRLDGSKYPSEQSTRSRSLLFIALGLAAASVSKVQLWIPENGFASINPPLGRERLGSLSTRTTHPAFLDGLVEVLTTVGAHCDLSNPFADMTKGEMFLRAGELVGPKRAAKFLNATVSCAHTGQRSHRISTKVSCGVCFGCVVRRASFRAAGFKDQTDYIAPGSNKKLKRWMDANSVEQPVRNFIARGVDARDLAALGLPLSYPMADALDLCRRGIAELATLYP